jgi:hypothetical protein
MQLFDQDVKYCRTRATRLCACAVCDSKVGVNGDRYKLFMTENLISVIEIEYIKRVKPASLFQSLDTATACIRHNYRKSINYVICDRNLGI